MIFGLAVLVRKVNGDEVISDSYSGSTKNINESRRSKT